MALAVVEEGIAGKAGKVQEAAGKAGSLGADAVVGVDLDYEVLGSGNSMLMVSAIRTGPRPYADIKVADAGG